MDGRYSTAMGSSWRSARRLVPGVLVAVVLTLCGVTAGAATQLGTFQITYYWFVPETGFAGKPVAAPGISGTFREDFLYSAKGVDMQGTGRAANGSYIHYAGTYGGYWVNAAGQRTDPGARGWSHGAPVWRDGGWRNAAGAPTFKRSSGTWSNGKGVKLLAYHDRFGLGKGVPVTEWHSIATDLRVIPRGTRVYVQALGAYPSGGCLVAEDTGSAIIGTHIDVLVPAGTNLGSLPSSGNVVTLAPGDACPPVLDPVALGQVSLTYITPARARDFRGRRAVLAALKLSLPETFLYSPRGVVRHDVGELRDGRRLVFTSGGWWVNARGKKTKQRADGSWSNGPPVWRDGGYRNRRGQPTRKLHSGHWTHGKGVVLLPYHDRFQIAGAADWIGWRSAGAPKGMVGAGTLLKIDALPAVGCLRVDHTIHTARTIEVLAPYGTALGSLPVSSTVTALPSDAAAACAD
jgi:3D (Asp-Asp-Asp) domain-containing protein